ncbi:DUF4199 domain-containing protein [Rufibacter soli]
MEEQTVTPASVGIRYGLITGFISIIYSLLLFVTGLHLNKGFSYLAILIPIVGIVFAYRNFKNENGGFMSYGQGLGTGTILGAVSGVMSSIFSYIYIKFIDGSIMEQIRNGSIEEMEQKGLSDEQIDNAIKITEKFSTPEMMFLFGLIGAVFMAFLISLIVAAVMKNNRPEFE